MKIVVQTYQMHIIIIGIPIGTKCKIILIYMHFPIVPFILFQLFLSLVNHTI